MAAIDDALRRRLLVHAFELARREARLPGFSQRRDRLLLDALKGLFLNPSKDERFAVPMEDIQSAIVSLIRSLANHPDTHNLRIGLTALVQPSIAGTSGLALMASVVLSLASEPLGLEKRPLPGKAAADWIVEHKPFVRSLFAWLKSEEPIVIGRFTTPANFLTEPADEIVSAIADYIEHAPVASDEDVHAVQTWLALGAAVAPHSSDPDFDLRLLRLAAGKLASAGFPQIARDLAEQALLNSTETPRRRRLGWFTMADVYHRANNHIEGLLALACTFASDDRADEEEAFQEIAGLARLLRDIGLLQFARTAIGKARQVLQRMGLIEKRGHRLDTLDLQIRQLSMGREGPHTQPFQTLLNDAVVVAEAVLAHHDQTEPIASVLGQLLRQARDAGAATPPNADAVLTELIGHAKGGLAIQLRAMQAAAPTVDDMLKLLNAGGSARYSDDVGFDIRTVALLASRSLANDRFLVNPDDVSFALELLADRGVAMPGWDEAAEPPPAPSSAKEAGAFARQFSREGVSIVQVGWDDRGRLVRLEAIDGALGVPVREPEELIEEQRFRAWSTSFPYAYGIDGTTTNLFYTTTEKLRFSSLPIGPVVLVSNVGFQAFPPNLLHVDGDFAGRTRPIAAVPSLAWLGSVKARGPIGDGRRCAWIPTADGGGDSQTLAMIAQRLEPTLQDHCFEVDNGPALPAAFSGASMAVITAHGGIHPEGRYFQVVSDEGVLRVSAADLAGALRNVGAVILFVCSGGRADKHPAANTTLGLAKQILDRGSTAVLASPWPLDARVPAYWLPAFLEQWEHGAALVQANFAANAAVDRAFALDPARGLAMTLFGDPNMKAR